ncbi:MAG TPA: hypothetical protein VF128_10745 [Gemmatimonadaceae bacterium]
MRVVVALPWRRLATENVRLSLLLARLGRTTFGLSGSLAAARLDDHKDRQPSLTLSHTSPLMVSGA